MLEYFNVYFVQLDRGLSYILTNFTFTFAIVLLLNNAEKDWRGVLKKLGECLLCAGGTTLLTALCYTFIHEKYMDRVALGLFLIFYTLLISKYDLRLRVVRAFTFAAFIMVILPISEPIGEALSNINESYFAWGQYLTYVVVLVLTTMVVIFLRHYSFGNDSVAHPQFMILLAVISLLTILSQVANLELEPVKAFNVTICGCLLIINMLTYYLFYSVAKVSRENADLVAMRHKAELEAEKYQVSKMSYDELSLLRHEIKNHNFYLKTLLDDKKYDSLSEYLSNTADSQLELLQAFSSGNYTIDVIMNHEMGAARLKNVAIQAQVVVPHELPFREEDMCSLLTNLMDNAIEAAAQSRQESPLVSLSILPRQDYLFIKVVNPVDENLPAQRYLSLKTTKKRGELHGYGTRVIQRIVERYNGSVKYSLNQGTFMTDVMLELKKEDVA